VVRGLRRATTRPGARRQGKPSPGGASSARWSRPGDTSRTRSAEGW